MGKFLPLSGGVFLLEADQNRGKMRMKLMNAFGHESWLADYWLFGEAIQNHSYPASIGSN